MFCNTKGIKILLLVLVLILGISSAHAYQVSVQGKYSTIYVDWSGTWTNEALWAYSLWQYQAVDYAFQYAYYGMGYDLLDSAGLNTTKGQKMAVYLYNKNDGLLGYNDGGFNTHLNLYYYPTATYNAVFSGNWQTNAYMVAGTIAHETSHALYYSFMGYGFRSRDKYEDNFLTEALAHYIGAMFWPVHSTLSGSNFTTTDYYTMQQKLLNDGYRNNPVSWYKIATEYNFTSSYPSKDRDNLFAAGLFLTNYYDFTTGYSGFFTGGYNLYGQQGIVSHGGVGGSWNAAALLYLVRLGYSMELGSQAVYGYRMNFYSYSTRNTGDLYSRYYLYYMRYFI
jgi:hypothetical protein